jgi:hypothetical protein
VTAGTASEASTASGAVDTRLAARGWTVRGLAAAVDALAGLGIAMLLASSAGAYFAERAAVTFRIGQPGTHWTGLVPFLLGAIAPLAYGLPFGLLSILIMEPLFAASPGKLLLRSEIVPVAPGPRPMRLWTRFALKAAPAWIACVALVAGEWTMALVAALTAGVVLLGSLPVLAARPALHDRVAGTTVVRRRPS